MPTNRLLIAVIRFRAKPGDLDDLATGLSSQNESVRWRLWAEGPDRVRQRLNTLRENLELYKMIQQMP
jgi:hypothetical protein